ncbi:MAG: hypothetical protein PHO08_11015 [Methylococcales bacterium]|nr:hypothetical protein [Methylococcales bacterium]
MSRNIVRKLLKKNDYVKRKALKKKAAGGHVNRNAQFERIAELRALAEGVAVPHTLYDMERNEACVNIGTSRDTGEFSCDSIRHWWHTYGIDCMDVMFTCAPRRQGSGANLSGTYLH